MWKDRKLQTVLLIIVVLAAVGFFATDAPITHAPGTFTDIWKDSLQAEAVRIEQRYDFTRREKYDYLQVTVANAQAFSLANPDDAQRRAYDIALAAYQATEQPENIRQVRVEFLEYSTISVLGWQTTTQMDRYPQTFTNTTLANLLELRRKARERLENTPEADSVAVDSLQVVQ